jgi:hypothetical protein
LIANDDPLDNFITFIGDDSFQILQHIKLDGSDSNAMNLLFFGRTAALCVADAGPPRAWTRVPQPPPARIRWQPTRRNQVYVPIRGNNGTVTPSTGAGAGATCSTAKDAHGTAGRDALGCIAIYTAPRDHDLKARRAPAFMPGVESASPGRAISHTPLEDV